MARPKKPASPPPELPPLDAQKWPAAEIVWRKVSALVPYARNARTHSERQVAQIRASMREWGWTIPCLIDDKNGLIAGHGRVMAATAEGLEWAPCMVALNPDGTPWSAAKKRAYVLADNQLAQNAGWDEELLALELGDLQMEGFDLGLIGFDADALDSLLGTSAGAEGEGAAEAKAKLADKFMLPPFSVLNAREGGWQDRKRAWLALGIQSELGRGGSEADASFKNQDKLDAFRGRKADAIPGGAGANSVYRDGGAKMRAQRLDTGKGGSLVDQMAAGKGTARAEKAARKASPGGNRMPATDYSKSHAKGDGRGKAIAEAPDAKE